MEHNFVQNVMMETIILIKWTSKEKILKVTIEKEGEQPKQLKLRINSTFRKGPYYSYKNL